MCAVERFPRLKLRRTWARQEGHSTIAENRTSHQPKSRKVFGHLSGGTRTPFRVGLYACISIHDQQIIPAKFAQPLKNQNSALRQKPKFGLTPCEPLLISQGHNGVRLRRAPCRNVAGEQRDSGQDQRDDDERQRVGGLDAVEQVGQEAGQS